MQDQIIERFTWRHGGHVDLPEQGIGVLNWSLRILEILLLLENVLLFYQWLMASGHVFENILFGLSLFFGQQAQKGSSDH